MHAVVVNVTITDPDRAEGTLRERIVPMVSQAPGAVAGYWLQPQDGKAQSMVIFESEDAARAMAAQVDQMPDAPVSFDSIEVREVAASF